MIEAKARSVTEIPILKLITNSSSYARPMSSPDAMGPQFFLRTTDVTGEVELPEGTEMVMPGDTVNLTVKLVTPVAMEDQMHFAIREGGKTVGAGVVTKIIK